MPTYIDTNMRAGGLQAKSKGATRRGLQVFHMTELMNVQGVGKEGKHLSVEYEQPMFRLSLDERVDMFQACSPVFGVVSSRMNRIAGLEWDVIPESKQEDKIAQDMKMKNAIYKEYSQSDSLKDQVVASVMKKQIQQQLSDVKDDMSNFDSALMRWSRRIKMTKQNIADELDKKTEKLGQEIEKLKDRTPTPTVP